jgi:ribose 5-phosphate isomerase A
MKVGLGTGSTVYYAILKIGALVKDGLHMVGIPTSNQTEALAKELGIPLTNFAQTPVLDVTIDGADAVLPDLSLIKGGGGALLREKLVASSSKRFIVVVDESKLVDTFDGLPIPIEVVPFAWETTAERIRKMGGNPTLRMKDDQTFVTDNHNYILDTTFEHAGSTSHLHETLKNITGVVDTGLFPDLADKVIVAGENETRILER